MEKKVDALIDSIKRKGIEEAEKETLVILDNAKRNAKNLVEEAQKNADELIQKANDEVSMLKQSAQSWINNAKRDVLIDLKKEVDALFNKFLKQEVKTALTTESFVSMLSSFLNDELRDAKVQYSKSDFDKIKSYIHSKTVAALIKDKRIEVGSDVLSGFAIKSDKNDYYIDCSEDEVSKLLSSYLKES